jgi:hypothetical protein
MTRHKKCMSIHQGARRLFASCFVRLLLSRRYWVPRACPGLVLSRRYGSFSNNAELKSRNRICYSQAELVTRMPGILIPYVVFSIIALSMVGIAGGVREKVALGDVAFSASGTAFSFTGLSDEVPVHEGPVEAGVEPDEHRLGPGPPLGLALLRTAHRRWPRRDQCPTRIRLETGSCPRRRTCERDRN